MSKGDFCDKCGFIMNLPYAEKNGVVKCFNQLCGNRKSSKDSIGLKASHHLSYNESSQKKQQEKIIEDNVQGPTIDHVCKYCKHTEATYFTRQMRSADEGQTVFYTCLNCKQVEREDS